MNAVVINRPNIALLNGRDVNLVDRDISIMERVITNRRNNNKDTYGRIATDEANLLDAVTHYSNISFRNVGKELEAVINVDDGKYEFKTHKNAVMQLANKFKINGRHISNLLKDNSGWATDVLAYTLSKYTANTRMGDMGLIRAVGQDNHAELRAIMSDSYHRYSTSHVYGGLLREVKDKAIVLKTQYDGLSSYMELISKDMKSFYADGKLVNMMFGLQIRNSSFGTAALDVKPFTFKVVCGNGMTTTSTLRSIHMGSKKADYGFLSNETLMLEAELNKRRVLDAANFIFSDEQINEQINAMTLLAEEKVDAKELKQLSKMGINQKEMDEINDIILGGAEDDGLLGNNSAYDVTQAITKIAQSKPLVREKELQDIGGSFIQNVINMSKKK
jgi:hypothetical protein